MIGPDKQVFIGHGFMIEIGRLNGDGNVGCGRAVHGLIIRSLWQKKQAKNDHKKTGRGMPGRFVLRCFQIGLLFKRDLCTTVRRLANVVGGLDQQVVLAACFGADQASGNATRDERVTYAV